MKKYFLLLFICCSQLLVSCGEDNDDFVLPEDVSNINLETGITFGAIQTNCEANCFDIYRWSENGIFRANNDSSTIGNYTFFECPISEEVRFVSQVDGVPNVPRGLRDIPSTDINLALSEIQEFLPEVYVIEYTLNSGVIKTIQFFGGNNSSSQISDYYNYIISTTQALNSLDTTPVNCIN